jgi:cell division protein FtsB
MNGRHGLEAKSEYIERLTLLDFEIKSLEAGRARLATDVALLAPDQPHPDIVEDIARDTLGYVYPSDRVLLAP